jgi:hypothetical protein
MRYYQTGPCMGKGIWLTACSQNLTRFSFAENEFNSPNVVVEWLALLFHIYLFIYCILWWELDLLTRCSVWLQTGRPGFDPRRMQRILLASVSRPALMPTQPPAQWVPEVLSPGIKRGRGVTLTTHPHLVPKSRMSRSYISSPPWRLHGLAGKLYFYFMTFFQ